MTMWRRKKYSFKQVDYASTTILMGLIPVSLAIILFEILIDVKPYCGELSSLKIADNYNLKMLIYYIVAGFAHLVICSVIVYHFYQTTKKEASTEIIKAINKRRIFFLAIMFISVYFFDCLRINIAYLSHERLYKIMSQSIFFKQSFKAFPKDFIPFLGVVNWFHIFSIFPFFQICFAIAVMIFGCFYVGRELYVYIDQKNDIESPQLIKQFIADLNKSLKNYFQLLSVVLVSSTIATVLFLQVPVSLIKDEKLRLRYNDLSMAMGVCWGVIFSLTLLFLCIYPYKLIYKKISSLSQNVRVMDNTELEDWIDENTSYYSLVGNVKLILSILSPATAGIITTIISKSI
jgi:hypothetical protein